MSQALSSDPVFAGTKTEVRFVAGFEPEFNAWDNAAARGLTNRFAVIQESYRPDCVDMFFDEPLWRRLVAFASQYDVDAELRIVCDGTPKTLERFFQYWEAVDRDDREPHKISLRRGDKSVLVIDPEFWTAVGGPMPYHDSYTYSIYSNEELGDRVVQFLKAAEKSDGWDLSTTIYPPNSDHLWSNRGTTRTESGPTIWQRAWLFFQRFL